MVILSVHNTADIYGGSRCLVRMLRLFAEDGHDVHVVLPRVGPLVGLLKTHGITVHIFRQLAMIERVPLGSLSGKMAFVFRLPYSVCWLSVLILRVKADVVHTNTAVLPAPALAARLTKRRHLWHIREFFSEFPSIWKFYQEYMWRLSTTIFTISSAVEDQFEPRFRAKCRLIYDGLDDESMQVEYDRARRFRSSIGDPAFLVGVVGRIKWARKGQEVLIKAAAILAERYPGARYAIAGTVATGNEDHLHRLRALIRTYSLEERVTFMGDIQDTRDMYAAFDVTVVPSVLPEPFGCVVMESMAAGTPVIGSRCGGIPEQIVDGVTGFLFNPGDAEDLARVLARAMSNNVLTVQMGQASKKRFQEKFSMATAYHRFADVFGSDDVPPGVAAVRKSA